MQRKIILIAILAVLLMAGVFYWYEYRPSQIRKSCERSARITESWGDVSYEIAYQGCLRYKGLEK